MVLALAPISINFDKVKSGTKSETRYVSLAGIDKDITKITSVTSKNEYLKAEAGHSDTAEGRQKLIKVTVLPGMKMGSFRDKITINTDHKNVKELSLYVRGQIVGNIHVSPSYLRFSPSRRDGKIILKALFDTSFKVIDVTSTTPHLVTKVETIRQGMDYWILVRAEDDFKFEDNLLKGKITIRTDDKEQENIDIGFSIYGKGPRKIRQDKTERGYKKPAEKE